MSLVSTDYTNRIIKFSFILFSGYFLIILKLTKKKIHYFFSEILLIMNFRETKYAAYSFEQKSSSSNVSSTNQQNGSVETNSKDNCARCTYYIYPLELMGSIMGKRYHRTCFKCFICDRQLDLKTYQTNQIDLTDNQIYCSSHAPRNGKGTIGFNSPSQTSSPIVQHVNIY